MTEFHTLLQDLDPRLNRTWVLCTASSESQPLDHQGSPMSWTVTFPNQSHLYLVHSSSQNKLLFILFCFFHFSAQFHVSRFQNFCCSKGSLSQCPAFCKCPSLLLDSRLHGFPMTEGIYFGSHYLDRLQQQKVLALRVCKQFGSVHRCFFVPFYRLNMETP